MIELSEMGSFSVGGREIKVSGLAKARIKLSEDAHYEADPNGTYWIDGAYVQYFKPVHARQNTPLLLVHGGGLTGVTWETTPDGRVGWLSRLLEAGFIVYVIDNVERGRAGFCAFDGFWQDKAIVRSDEEAWAMYRFGWIDAEGKRNVFPGQRFPVSAMSALAAQTVPRWAANTPRQIAALNALIARVGPAVLIGHSQGGGISLNSTDQNRSLVRACVMLEPHGMPMSFIKGVPGIPAYFMVGDFINKHEYWTQMRLKYRLCLEAWKAAGGKGDICDLPGKGIAGNSHMLMMDNNSDQVLDIVVNWLDSQRKAGVFD